MSYGIAYMFLGLIVVVLQRKKLPTAQRVEHLTTDYPITLFEAADAPITFEEIVMVMIST